MLVYFPFENKNVRRQKTWWWYAGGLSLTSQQRQPNCLIRQPICQIRTPKTFCGPSGFYKLKMKTGQDTSFCSICANSEIWQNRVDHTFDNMVVLNSISLVENDVLIKWTNKVDKSEKPGGPQNFFGVLIWQIGCLIRQFGWRCCDVRMVHLYIIVNVGIWK